MAKYTATIEPLRSNLTIDVTEKEAGIEKTAGGIFIQTDDSKKEKTTIGIVKDVGPDVVAVKPGDKIIYQKYAGTNIPLRNPTLKDWEKDLEEKIILILDEADVLCIMHDKVEE